MERIVNLPDYRLVIKLKAPPNIVVPYNHRHQLVGLFYSLLENVSPEIGDKLHNKGYTERIKDKRKYKFYTQSLLATHAAYKREGFTSTNGEWEYWFSSADPLILAILEHALSLLNSISVGSNTFKIREKKGMRVPLRKKGGLFRCVSPIAVKQKDGEYLSPGDENFSDGVLRALINRYQLWTGKELTKDDIKFDFVRPRRKVIHYREARIESYSGKFEFNAPPEALQFAQLVGLGNLNSIGMGMIA